MCKFRCKGISLNTWVCCWLLMVKNLLVLPLVLREASFSLVVVFGTIVVSNGSVFPNMVVSYRLHCLFIFFTLKFNKRAAREIIHICTATGLMLRLFQPYWCSDFLWHRPAVSDLFLSLLKQCGNDQARSSSTDNNFCNDLTFYCYWYLLWYLILLCSYEFNHWATIMWAFSML